MVDKSTDELDKLLGKTHVSEVSSFLKENRDVLISQEHPFSAYMKEILKKNNRLQQQVFLDADIPERYGYKLLSEQKRTKQRDIILRICYAACLTLEETQKALRLYGMPEMYARIPRDAVLMICFNERPGSVLEVNNLLNKNKLPPLKSCGTLD